MKRVYSIEQVYDALMVYDALRRSHAFQQAFLALENDEEVKRPCTVLLFRDGHAEVTDGDTCA